MRPVWDGTNPAQITALLATTLERSRDEIVDNVFKSNVFWSWLRRSGKVDYQSGGDYLSVPLMYGKNTTAEPYQGFDVLSVDPQEGITSGAFLWKQYHVAITIDGLSLKKNKSVSRLANILDAKKMQAQKSLASVLNYDAIFGNIADPKRLTGLRQVCQNAAQGAQTTAVGNIKASSYSWWANQYLSLAGNAFGEGTEFGDGTPAGMNGQMYMTRMYNLCSDGADHPDLIICDSASFENFERAISSQRSLVNTTVADIGFQHIAFKGALVVWDQLLVSDDAGNGVGVGDGEMYFLNSDYLKLLIEEDTDFEIRTFGFPPNQDAWISNIFWMGELTCSNRSKQGVLKGTAIWQ